MLFRKKAEASRSTAFSLESRSIRGRGCERRGCPFSPSGVTLSSLEAGGETRREDLSGSYVGYPLRHERESAKSRMMKVRKGPLVVIAALAVASSSAQASTP